MLVIAHRGCNKEKLENSMSAFEAAVNAGAARIELDVHLSRDSKLFVIHDENLGRVTGEDVKISDLDAFEISKIKLKNGESIPSLEDVIVTLLPRIELNIEIKGNNAKLANAAGRLVQSQALRERVIFSSFCPDPLFELRDSFPQLKRACLIGDDQIHWPWLSSLEPVNFLQEARTKILHPRADLVDENLMDQARTRGWTVFAWVPMVGEEQGRDGLWSYLKTMKIDGLCTNYPRELLLWLKKEKEYETHLQSR